VVEEDDEEKADESEEESSRRSRTEEVRKAKATPLSLLSRTPIIEKPTKKKNPLLINPPVPPS